MWVAFFTEQLCSRLDNVQCWCIATWNWLWAHQCLIWWTPTPSMSMCQIFAWWSGRAIQSGGWDHHGPYSKLTTSELKQLFKDSLTMNMSHRIFLINHLDKEDVSSWAIVSHITSSIMLRLKSCYLTLELCEQIHLYKSLSKAPKSRVMAGIFFGAAGQQCLQHGMELRLFQMVVLASMAFKPCSLS